MVAFDGNEPDSKQAFYERLAAIVQDWPIGERNIVQAWRSELGKSLSFNLIEAEQSMREGGLISGEDPASAFERSIDYFIEQLIPRQTGAAKAGLLQLRTKRRTPKLLRVDESPPKKERKGDDKPTPEVRRDPIELVSCNLQDGTTSPGTEPMIAAYLEKIGQQGSTVIREDIEHALRHLARTDLPPTRRRGIKHLDRFVLRFGENEESWEVYELKPTVAAGLSMRSDTAKNSRVYFIKLEGNKWGIFGIGLRSEQEEFLRRTCIKAKQRR